MKLTNLLFLFVLFINPLTAQTNFTPLFESLEFQKTDLKIEAFSNAQRISKLAIDMPTKNGAIQLPSQVRFNLFSDTFVDVQLEKETGTFYKNLEVYRGYTKDAHAAHLAHYRDVVVVSNPHTGKIAALIEGRQGTFQILPDPDSEDYLVMDFTGHEFHCEDFMEAQEEAAIEAGAKSGCNEQDSNGDYIFDLFVGFSYDAAFRAGDIDAYALLMAEEVNNGFANSMIEGVRVRLVGTGINPENPGVVTSVLGNVYTWYADEIATTGADFVASVQVPTGGHKEAGGWAGVGGYSSVNSINSTMAVFRHEMGHNFGSSHCTGGVAVYAAGHSHIVYDDQDRQVAKYSTHMCGNNLNYYSNTRVTYNDPDHAGEPAHENIPLGDAATADNARLIEERAALMSNKRKHTILYDANDTGCGIPIANGRYYIQNVNSNLYLGTQDNATNNGRTLAQQPSEDPNTLWEITSIGAGKYKLRHISSNREMDVPGSSGTAGRDLIIWSISNSRNHQFTLTPVEGTSNHFKIQAFNGQCVQVENAGTTANDVIEQNSCDNTTNTHWRFVSAGANNNLTVLVDANNITCFGETNGTASATVSGGSGNYTYDWGNGDVGNSTSNLSAGEYTLTVSDGTTTLPFTFVIKQPEAIQVATQTTTSSLNNDGTISVTASNGTAPYSYLWSTGATGNSVQNLSGGLYSVVVTDATGCAVTEEIFVPCTDFLSPCDDGNPNTLDDYIDANCDCVGTELTCNNSALTLTNVAMGKPATQSSISHGGTPNRVVDGNRNGVYRNGSVNHTDNSEDEDTGLRENPWWEVDLEQVEDINSIIVWNRTDCCSGRLQNSYVFISEEPFLASDEKPEDILGRAGVYSYKITNIPLPNIVIQPNIMGRYIRIHSERDAPMNIAEVEVYACTQCLFYTDNDGDGFGDINSPQLADCDNPGNNLVTNSDDCDDNNADINPNTVTVCGTPTGTALTINPLDNNILELKGFILPEGKTITSITIEHGENDFSNSTPISTNGVTPTDRFNVATPAEVGNASSYQFRIRFENFGVVYYSDVFTFQRNQDYCTPSVDMGQAGSNPNPWYKRFNKVNFEGQEYNDGGDIKYDDQTAINFGELEMGATYDLALSTPSSQWWNLTFRVYIDLNADGDFTDYNEMVGMAPPSGQMTPVTITIPSEDIRTGQDLRMRILGHETNDYSPCYSRVGNYKDFTVSVKSNAPVLYVDLVSFTAKVTDNQEVKLNWESAVEINNDFYIIERSTDGKEFYAIEEVFSKGNSNDLTAYEYLDTTPENGANYYRIRTISKTGTAQVSPIQQVQVKATINTTVYPNPISNGAALTVGVEGNINSNEIVIFYLLDVTNRIIAQQPLVEGTNQITLPQVTTGVYFYRINGIEITGKLVVK